MRAGWAALAAVAVVCAVPAAADGAVAVIGGVPDAALGKGEVQADVAAVISRVGLHSWSDGETIVLRFSSGRKGTPMPPQCMAEWPDATAGTPEEADRLLAELGRAGWHQVFRKDEAGWHSVALDRGGWRLSVVDMRGRPGSGDDDLIVDAVRLGC
jgi:hypothetical protein|nr:hypothetical protein OH826_03555 [Streptomyces sp. NBC_00899]WSX80931.1 hypothetical protein OH826_47955 [Streptomyces sp. NBC_00899]